MLDRAGKGKSRLLNFLSKRIIASAVAILFAISLAACNRANKPSEQAREKSQQTAELQQPTIEAAPVEQGGDQWKVATSDTITLTVTAPGAAAVKILYRPVFVEGRHIELKTLKVPSDPARAKFSSQLKIGTDFAGDVWAEATYPNGAKKETEPIALTADTTLISEESPPIHSDKSARADKFTGGKIEKTALQRGQSDIKITVNVPAFQLTLWQNGKEVRTYQIGIGRKNFPIPISIRRATQIVFNPEWIPPNSPWVNEHEVSPGERIEAEDLRNPLGKIKIPLGNGILIHQAVKPSDIGHLASHGCVRLLTDDIFDLAEKIIAARSLPLSKQQIEHAKNSKDRLAVKLDAPLYIDINYDTQVIEGGVLHLYPDVYNRKTNSIENLRAELQSSGVDPSKLDDETLRQMIDRVSMAEEFVLNVADIKASRALIAGRNQPLTEQSVIAKPTPQRPRRNVNSH